MQLKIRELREARKMTVDQLAELVGLSKSYVSEIERGKKIPNKTRIEQFARALQVKVFDLIDDIGLTHKEREMLSGFSDLPEDLQDALLSMSRAYHKQGAQ